MRTTLIVVGGKATKGRVSLDLPVVIGRSRSADLTVAHPMISRLHCEVFDSNGVVMVRDLDSLNGTLVEGEKVSEAALKPEDRFTVGPLTFRVDYEYSGELDGTWEEDDEPAAGEAGERPVEIIGGSDVPAELEETQLEEESSEFDAIKKQLPNKSQPPERK